MSPYSLIDPQTRGLSRRRPDGPVVSASARNRHRPQLTLRASRSMEGYFSGKPTDPNYATLKDVATVTGMVSRQAAASVSAPMTLNWPRYRLRPATDSKVRGVAVH